MVTTDAKKVNSGEVSIEIILSQALPISDAPRYTEQQIRKVCELLTLGFRASDIFAETGVTAKTVSAIKRRNKWASVSSFYVW